MKSKVNGFGGAVCLDMEGNAGIAHTTERMAWAHIREDTLGEKSQSGMSVEPSDGKHLARL